MYQQIDTTGKPKKAIFPDRGCSAQDSAIQNRSRNRPKIEPKSMPLENQKQRFRTRGGRKFYQKTNKNLFKFIKIDQRSVSKSVQNRSQNRSNFGVRKVDTSRTESLFLGIRPALPSRGTPHPPSPRTPHPIFNLIFLHPICNVHRLQGASRHPPSPPVRRNPAPTLSPAPSPNLQSHLSFL